MTPMGALPAALFPLPLLLLPVSTLCVNSFSSRMHPPPLPCTQLLPCLAAFTAAFCPHLCHEDVTLTAPEALAGSPLPAGASYCLGVSLLAVHTAR